MKSSQCNIIRHASFSNNNNDIDAVIDTWASEIKDITECLQLANKKLDFVTVPWKMIANKCIPERNSIVTSDQGILFM